jgi:hypothetical protein
MASDNFINRPLLIAALTVDTNGNECPDGGVPIREDSIYGRSVKILVRRGDSFPLMSL